MFERLWSVEDEIVLLERVLEYASFRRSDPGAHIRDFHEFVRNDISVVVTEFQLKDKIRRLRKRYLKIRVMEERKGKDRVFKWEHDARRHQLAKLIWGEEDWVQGVKITIGITRERARRRRRSGRREVGESSRGVRARGVGLDMEVVAVPVTATTAEEAVVREVEESPRGVGARGGELDMAVVAVPGIATTAEEAVVVHDDGLTRMGEHEEGTSGGVDGWRELEIREIKSEEERLQMEIREIESEKAKLQMEFRETDLKLGRLHLELYQIQQVKELMKNKRRRRR